MIIAELEADGTAQSSAIATRIRKGLIDPQANGAIEVYFYDSHKELRAAARSFDKSQFVDPGLEAFNVENQIHLVQDENAYVNAVHEGSHAIDSINGARNSFKLEVGAYVHQVEFEAAKGLPLSFASLYDIELHVATKYPWLL